MPIDHEEVVFKKLTGKYKHYCPDWDEMAIDETCPEFQVCTCFKPEKPSIEKETTMSNDLMNIDAQLPAHLRDAVADSTTDSLVVQGPSFPRLSLKGSKFRLRDGGEEKLIKLDEFQVVIVAAMPQSNVPAKVFYKSSYAAGDDQAPDCMSSDGIRPDRGVDSPQSQTTCAACPQNAWGSAKTNDGRDAKACKDTKALYVVVPKGDDVIDKVIQVRIPTMSLKHLSKYAALLKSKKIPVNAVITKLSFDESKEYPEVLFNFGGFLSEAQYDKVREIGAGDVITQVLEGNVAIAEPSESVEEAPAPTVEEQVVEAKKEAQSVFDEDLGEYDEEDEEAPEALELDSDGRPWDERIDSSSKKKSKTTGRWARRRNTDDDEYLRIKKELIAKYSGKTAPATQTGGSQSQESPTETSTGSLFDDSEPAAPADDSGDIDDELDAILAGLD